MTALGDKKCTFEERKVFAKIICLAEVVENGAWSCDMLKCNVVAGNAIKQQF